MKATDILLDADYDLAIERGDLVAGESDAQHLELLLQTNQGEWRQDPLVGVGLGRYLSSPYGPQQAAELTRTLSIQLERDGYSILELDLAELSSALINAERL
jgi:hypothetical protein